MYIKKEVIQSLIKFQKDGYQRWSEMIFSYQASEKGFKTIVLAHHLYHYGISTKKSEDVEKSSLSWMIESNLWDKVVKKYFLNVTPIQSYERNLGNNLIEIINQNDEISLYGCGTVAQLIIQRNPNKNFNASQINSIFGTETSTRDRVRFFGSCINTGKSYFLLILAGSKIKMRDVKRVGNMQIPF